MKCSPNDYDASDATKGYVALCPKCSKEMECVQIFESYRDFVTDGKHYWFWTCKCGYEERVEQ